MRGDKEARERLRSLLSRLDFKVFGAANGGLRFVNRDRDIVMPVTDSGLYTYLPEEGAVVVATPSGAVARILGTDPDRLPRRMKHEDVWRRIPVKIIGIGKKK